MECKITYLGKESHAAKSQDHEVELSKQDSFRFWSILLVPSPFVVPLLSIYVYLISR